MNTKAKSDLIIDEERSSMVGTGLYVRARDWSGNWRAADIMELDRKSLLTWLRSRGGDNVWAENVVGMLMGHGFLHEDSSE